MGDLKAGGAIPSLDQEFEPCLNALNGVFLINFSQATAKFNP